MCRVSLGTGHAGFRWRVTKSFPVVLFRDRCRGKEAGLLLVDLVGAYSNRSMPPARAGGGALPEQHTLAGVSAIVLGGVSLAGGPVSSSAVLPLPDLDNKEEDTLAARPRPTPGPRSTAPCWPAAGC